MGATHVVSVVSRSAHGQAISGMRRLTDINSSAMRRILCATVCCMLLAEMVVAEKADVP